MARRFSERQLSAPVIAKRFVFLAGILLIAAGGAFAAPVTSPSPAPPGAKPSPTPPSAKATPAPVKDPSADLRRLFDQLPQDQQKKLLGTLKPASPAPAPPATAFGSPKPGQPQKPDESDQVRHLFDQLSSAQQKKFMDNLMQWRTMSPEEQEFLRTQAFIKREKMAEEIQSAISKSGLHLDDDQREIFALRYTQERRKIEEELRKEADVKRASMVTQMMARLKAEFAATPPPIPGVFSSPAH